MTHDPFAITVAALPPLPRPIRLWWDVATTTRMYTLSEEAAAFEARMQERRRALIASRYQLAVARAAHKTTDEFYARKQAAA